MKRPYGHDKVAIALLTAHLCLLATFAFTRLVDGDEGFYLSAAQEVAEGKSLYQDFFYPQMPYLPYIFSVFAGNGFETLYATRLASAAAAMMAVLLFYLVLTRLETNRTIVRILLAMYVFSGLAVSYYPVAKTFAWTGFFLMTAFYFLTQFDDRPGLWPTILAGAAMALAVNVRFVLAPAAVLFLIYILMSSAERRLRRIALFLGSMVVFSLPAMIIFFQDGRRFIFDNLGFHLMRNPGNGFPQTLYERLFVIGKMLINPQILLILIAVAAAFIVWRRTATTTWPKAAFGSAAGLAGIVALVLTLVHLLPNPIHQQYFVQAMPFALLASPSGIRLFLERRRRFLPFFSNRRLVVVLTAIYALGVVPYVVVFIGAVRDCDGYADVGNMKRLCGFLHDTAGDEPILSEHPIIPVLSGSTSFDGTEFLGYEYKDILDRDGKRFYRLTTNDDLREIIETKQALYCVVLDRPVEELSEAVTANYRLDTTFERYIVYRRN